MLYSNLHPEKKLILRCGEVHCGFSWSMLKDARTGAAQEHVAIKICVLEMPYLQFGCLNKNVQLCPHIKKNDCYMIFQDIHESA